MVRSPHSKNASLPSEGEVLDYIRNSDAKVTKRELARAFHIKGADRVALKAMLRDLEHAGKIAKNLDKSYRLADALPNVLVVEIDGIDKLGDLVARPLNYDGPIDSMPRIYLSTARKRRHGRLAPKDRALVRLKAAEDQDGLYYDATLIRQLDSGPRNIIGLYRGGGHGGRVIPSERKAKHDLIINHGDEGDAVDGDLVLAEAIPGRVQRGARGKRGRVIETLGSLSEPRAISLIALHHHGIPVTFPDAVIRESEGLKAATLEGRREDLRDMPLVTIDPADARDHDDAIFAEPDENPRNPGGWRIVVAIADVSYYIHEGSELDTEALKRGNSCYFPDRVVPMLPEAISNDLCSLKSGSDKAAMVADMRVNAKGKLISHRFYRALIRIAGNVDYIAVQRAIDGDANADTRTLLDPVLKPLYAAYASLKAARKARGPLELELPERRVIMGDDGHIESVTLRERFDSHRLVEDFMILANVAAAETLSGKKVPCMYRVHEVPDPSRIDELREFLEGLDLNLAKGQVLKPAIFNAILKKVTDSPYEALVNQVILRSQTQAYYSPDNQGHFGLALPKYAHFTSPIRRYSDILVHRALVRVNNLGPGGLERDDISKFRKIGEDISNLERRAMAAERESNDRYMAAYMADHVGDTLKGTISGVTRFGLFICLEPTGADGFVPMRNIASDYYTHDAIHHLIRGERTGNVYRLGDSVEVRVIEADHVTGSIRLELIEDLGEITKNAKGRPKGPRTRGPKNNARYRGKSKTTHRGKTGKRRR